MLMKIGFLLFTWLLAPEAEASSMIYVPENFQANSARVVVVIHGCLQTPESMALGTGWNQVADQNNLVVVYPQVPTGTNDIDCWSWFLPENQSPESGQLRRVRDEVLQWKKRLHISNAPVFVTGISSGAATTAGLLACFPKEFAAGAIHSGPSYGLASNLQEASKVLKDGPGAIPLPDRECQPKAFQKPVMALQGLADPIVNPQHVAQIKADFFPKARSVSSKVTEDNGLVYRVDDYYVRDQLRGRILRTVGLGHAWSGYADNLRFSELLGPTGSIPTIVPFFSAQGPSSTNAIFEFFDSVTESH